MSRSQEFDGLAEDTLENMPWWDDLDGTLSFLEERTKKMVKIESKLKRSNRPGEQSTLQRELQKLQEDHKSDLQYLGGIQSEIDRAQRLLSELTQIISLATQKYSL